MRAARHIASLPLLALILLRADGYLPEWATLPAWAEPIPPPVASIAEFTDPSIDEATGSIAEFTAPVLPEATESIAAFTAQPVWMGESDALSAMMIRAGVRYTPSPRRTLPAGVMLQRAGSDAQHIEAAWRFYQQSRNRAKLYQSHEKSTQE